jgi:cytoskeleton protein RodZ
MPEIGETLREARMRQRIDISEVEAATKIRAKYLRALENEEWNLLPGTTFVKTFLRTYGDYLGLDARLLVEEYRQRFEQPSTMDLTPFTPAPRRRGMRRGPPRIGPGVLMGFGVVVLLVVLYLLGTVWDTGDDGDDTAEPPPVTDQRPTKERDSGSKRSDDSERKRSGGSDGQQRSRKRVRLQIVATGAVWVCLENADGKRLVSSQTLQSGQKRGPYSSRRFRFTLGNGQARLLVNGRSRSVPPSSDPVGYEVTPSGRRELSEEQRPSCA